MKRFLSYCLSLLFAFYLNGSVYAQLDTTFTYQGELQQNGSPADGTFDMEFSLWDEASNGTQLSLTTSIENVVVAEGRFTAELDFGAEAFDESAAWLEVTVNGVTLSPRNRISPTPYSLQTRGLFVDNDGTVFASGGTDATLVGGGTIVIGELDGFNLSLDANEIMARNNGVATSLFLNLDGGNVFVGAEGKPSTLITNNLGNRNSLWVRGGTDATIGGANSGAILVGETDGQNLLIDANEIMARNNGQEAPLYLNLDGGNVYAGATGSDTRLITPVLQITGGSDFSEMFDLSSQIGAKPGMVVSIDPDNPGRLVLSCEANDHKVAGIISGAGGVATGMTMGHDGTVADGEYPIALTGRVYCFVDATKSAVEPGDLLTTSDRLGHAAKVIDMDDAQGAIIGKAMSGLEKGKQGLVLVLVSLQ